MLALFPRQAYNSPGASARNQICRSSVPPAGVFAMLQLQVLGTPSVNRDGGPCGGAAAQRKSLALVALLAVAGRRGLSRDKILAWLWPETPTDKATHRLAQLLYSLRRDLGTEELFLGSTDLRLNPAVVASDLAEFTAALESGDFPRAVAAYGGPFLDGFYLSDAPDFEHWVEEERAGFAQRQSAAVEALARDAAARGDVVAAAGWWRQLSQVEPFNARVAICYVEALCAAGDRPSALRFVRAYETLLRQQFDTEPDPAVVAAVERLRSMPTASPAAGVAPVPAIVVLPFVNLTPEGENAYFSDGVTDELANALTRVPGLRVASRTSAYSLGGKGLDAREIAERLGVSALVEGTVRKVGNRIRLSARLVNAADGCQLWSETYDRTIEDVFGLQEEVSRAIAAALPLAAGPASAPRVRRPTTVPDAYTLFLRGRYAARKRTPEGLALAIEYFEQAVEQDPGYALAHAGLAECWAMRGLPEFGDLPASEAGPHARAAALEALKLEPRLAQAHTWLGVIHFLFDWDWAAAGAQLRRAIQLDPGDAYAETWYALLLSALARHEESLRRILHAEAMEPLSLTIRLCVGRCYYFARRYDQAYDAVTAILKSEPGHVLSTIWLARTLNAMGRQAEAVTALARLPQDQQTLYARSVMAYALAGAGRVGEARAMCTGLEQDIHEGRLSPLYGMGPWAVLGERGKALAMLEEGLRRRDAILAWLLIEPAWDPIRDDPRFQRVLAELRLVPADARVVPS